MRPLPLSKRPIDIALIAFFCINLFFITYIVDVEQLVIADTDHFKYPAWPPAKMVDLVHWYGHNFDPVLIPDQPGGVLPFGLILFFLALSIWLPSMLTQKAKTGFVL
jgi:hypothetical protein